MALLVPPRDLPDSMYRPAFPFGLVAPWHPSMNGALNTGIANQHKGVRVLVPKDGLLRNLYVFVGTASGNVTGAVYDTGDTTAGYRKLLWGGASIPVVAGWLLLGDPQLQVLAGQQLDLVSMPDNAVATFAGVAGASSSMQLLPTGMWPCMGGAPPKLSWGYTAASYALVDPLPEGSPAQTAAARFHMAQVT